jgi:hypothetical protein
MVCACVCAGVRLIVCAAVLFGILYVCILWICDVRCMQALVLYMVVWVCDAWCLYLDVRYMVSAWCLCLGASYMLCAYAVLLRKVRIKVMCGCAICGVFFVQNACMVCAHGCVYMTHGCVYMVCAMAVCTWCVHMAVCTWCVLVSVCEGCIFGSNTLDNNNIIDK